MNFTPIKHFRIGFADYAPVSGKPMKANLLFNNNIIGEFQSLNKRISYNHHNYNLHSTAYDYDGRLYQVLSELNDEVFAFFFTQKPESELYNMLQYLLKDNRFSLPVRITDKKTAERLGMDSANLQYIINDAFKAYNK